MTHVRPVLLLLILSVLVSGVGWAQGDRTCEVVIDRTGGVGRQVDIGGGLYRLYQGGGVWAHCRDQPTEMYADSVAWYPERDRFDMVGNVRFDDATAELTARSASYYLGDERLEAFGDARLANRETGSLLTGPNLTYRRPVAGVRDTSELTADRRPRVEWRLADDPEAEPYVIVADRIRLVGETQAWAGGNVTIDRSDFHARSDSAHLDTDAGNGRLVGHASVEGGETAGYTLTGRFVSFRLEDGALNWVQAEELAEATSADWRIVADTVQFTLSDGRIQAGTAWGDSIRPSALSRTNTVTGDSLVIDAPDQRLSTVRAIGTGRATARRDSVDQESDWVAGDTVVVRFDSAGTDAGGISRIEAVGSGRTRYRIYEADGTTLSGISYSRGDRIVATFREDALFQVHVWGESDGVFLEASRNRPAEGR